MFTTKDKEGFQASCAKTVEVQGKDNVYNIHTCLLLYHNVARIFYRIYRHIGLAYLAGQGFRLTPSYGHAKSCYCFSVNKRYGIIYKYILQKACRGRL